MFNYMGMTEEQVVEGVQKYGPAQGARKVLDLERLAAEEAEKDGVYKTFWNEAKKSECFRVASKSKCFCGHRLEQHRQKYLSKKMDTGCEQCGCKGYKWVPIRPEECGMYWLPRRKDFKVAEWRPPCKCKHSTAEHDPNYPLRCRACKNCQGFWSDFACISCDGRWEDHQTIFESEPERRAQGKKVGKEFYPFSDMKELQEMVFAKKEKEIGYDPKLMRPVPKPGESSALQSPLGMVFRPKYPDFMKK
jgi:hypothetical protein